MRSRFVGRVALALALPLVAAGCGGDEGGPGEEKARYIDQSDAICSQTLQDISGLTGRDQQTAERLSQQWTEAGEQLRALPRPEEDFEVATRFVVDVENLAMSYTAAARALELNDQDKANQAFEEATMVKQRAAETAVEYGYEECVRIDEV